MYKAKTLKNGEWVTGAYYCYPEITPSPIDGKTNAKQVIINHRNIDWNLPTELVQHEIDPKTLCQYIGLEDSNGLPLYSNHKIRYKLHEEEEWEEDVIVYCAKNDYPAFDLKNNPYDCNGISLLKGEGFIIEELEFVEP